MQATIQATAPVIQISGVRLWAGRISSALVILFMIFDGVVKVLRLAPATEGTIALGYPVGTTFGIGAIGLACTALYALPRTAPLGALLLTGYFGGVLATHVRAGSPASSFVFVLVLSTLLWGGLFLRDNRLRALLGA
ncbi:MAG TPA: DoxX family protein [Thermomicrobiales bacterium]|jgi:hypothetical protein